MQTTNQETVNQLVDGLFDLTFLSTFTENYKYKSVSMQPSGWNNGFICMKDQ